MKTKEELLKQIKDVNRNIFAIEMSDRWTSDDWVSIGKLEDELKVLKAELEEVEKLECEQKAS